ncbi:hypothetical protein AAEX28_04705 [Lentisphaerota bacterium WC36G]|nr:hypothetical protein LJT99_07565 [Lentisphaerae bacterium WC36]
MSDKKDSKWFVCTEQCQFDGKLFIEGQKTRQSADFKHDFFEEYNNPNTASSDSLTRKEDFEEMRDGLSKYRKQIDEKVKTFDNKLKDATKTIAEQQTVINALDEKVKTFDGKIAISEDDLKKLCVSSAEDAVKDYLAKNKAAEKPAETKKK